MKIQITDKQEYIITLKDGSKVIMDRSEWDNTITQMRLKADKQHHDNIYHRFTSWRQKIKQGYFYKIQGSENLVCVTGSGGAILAGETFEKKGFSDKLIQSLILITESEGMTTDMIFYPLIKIVWRNK